MSRKKNKNMKRSFVKYALCFSFLAYVGYTFIAQQIDINSKKAELDAVNQQIVEAEAKTVNTPEYIEEFARTELDYASPDEIVFVDATAKN